MIGMNLGELASPENRGTLKLAIYELLYLVARASPRDSPGPWVPVNGGQPMVIADIAKQVGLSESGLYNNLRLLEIRGYIRRRPASHGVCIELSATLFHSNELYSQLQNSGNAGLPESRNAGPQENESQKGAPLSPPLPHSPSPPISPNQAKNKNIPPNGGPLTPAPSLRQFSQECHDLVNRVYQFLAVREALPATPKDRDRWRMRNMKAAKAMTDPSTGRSPEAWGQCLEWAGAQTYWADKVTDLSTLRAVWSAFQLAVNGDKRRPTRGGRGPSESNVMLQDEKKPDGYYDHIYKKFGRGDPPGAV
jgi:DNA-binding MarR family transcriptional regulator